MTWVEVNDKYEITKTSTVVHRIKVFRIKALKDFGDVKKGDLGGYVEGYKNLSIDGNCWIYDDAIVCENAVINNDAKVFNSAIVRGNAIVRNNARVHNHSSVYCNAQISDNACLFDNASVSDEAKVWGDAKLYDKAMLYKKAVVGQHAKVCGNVHVEGNALVLGNSELHDNVQVHGGVRIENDVRVYGETYITGNHSLSHDAIIHSNADYKVFSMCWESKLSRPYFTWTRSNDKWDTDLFYGSGEDLIKEGYKENSLCGRYFKTYVDLVEDLKEFDEYI